MGVRYWPSAFLVFYLLRRNIYPCYRVSPFNGFYKKQPARISGGRIFFYFRAWGVAGFLFRISAARGGKRTCFHARRFYPPSTLRQKKKLAEFCAGGASRRFDALFARRLVDCFYLAATFRPDFFGKFRGYRIRGIGTELFGGKQSSAKPLGRTPAAAGSERGNAVRVVGLERRVDCLGAVVRLAELGKRDFDFSGFHNYR